VRACRSRHARRKKGENLINSLADAREGRRGKNLSEKERKGGARRCGSRKKKTRRSALLQGEGREGHGPPQMLTEKGKEGSPIRFSGQCCRREDASLVTIAKKRKRRETTQLRLLNRNNVEKKSREKNKLLHHGQNQTEEGGPVCQHSGEDENEPSLLRSLRGKKRDLSHEGEGENLRA